jgi:RHS repeat-associated protein
MPASKKDRRRFAKLPFARMCCVDVLEARRLLTVMIDFGGTERTWADAPLLIAPMATLTSTLPGSTLAGIAITLEHAYSETLDCDVSGTNITKSIVSPWSVWLTLQGDDTLAHYQQVLRSVTYRNSAPTQSPASRTITVSFSPASGEFLTGGVTVKIPPLIWISDAGSDGTAPLPFVVNLTRTSTAPVSVAYATEDDPSQVVSAVADDDYVATSGRVTFQPGELTKTINVPVHSDIHSSYDVRPDEAFLIRLSAPTNGILLNADPYMPKQSRNGKAIGFIYDATLTNPNPTREQGFPSTIVDSTVATVPALATVATYTIGTGNTSVTQSFVRGPLSAASAAAYASQSLYYGAIGFGVARFDRSMLLMPDTSLWGTTLDPYDVPFTAMNNPAMHLPPGTALPTGTYNWRQKATFTSTSSPNTSLSGAYHGWQSIVNRTNSPYGPGWWINSLDQLFIQDELFGPDANTGYPIQIKPKGITDVLGNGEAVFFAYDSVADEYVTPHGYFLTLSPGAGGTYTVTNPQKEVKVFSSAGYLTSVTGPNGNSWAYDYNGDHTLSMISDSAGNAVAYEYANGKLASVTDQSGRTTSVALVDGARVVTSPPVAHTGVGAQISFSSGGLATSSGQSHPFGTGATMDGTFYRVEAPLLSPFLPQYPHLVTHIRSYYDYDYLYAEARVDPFGAVVNYTDFNGKTWSYGRDLNGLLTSVTPPGQSAPQHQYFYDDQGNVTRAITASTAGLPEANETWTYDPVFNIPDSYTDPLGHKTIYHINATTGQVASIQRVIGSLDGGDDLITSFTYTPAGMTGIAASWITSRIDPNGDKTRYAYLIDGPRLQVTVTEAADTLDQGQRTYVYDRGSMDLLVVTDERGHSTSYDYDDAGQLEVVTAPRPTEDQDAPAWHQIWNDGLLMTRIDPKQYPTEYGYYPNTALLYTVTLPAPDADHPNPVWTYDHHYSSGDTDAIIDPYGHTTIYYQDANGNLSDIYRHTIPPEQWEIGGIVIEDPADPHAQFTYNALNLLETEIDFNGNVTNYDYDERGQLIKVTAPPDSSGVTPITHHEYDNGGRLVKVTDPMARVTSYEYDDVDRLTKVTEPDPDAPGMLLPSRVTTYQYDKSGNLRFETITAGGIAQTTERRYDHRNRLIAVIEPAPQAGVSQPRTDYTYYATGELHTQHDANGNLTTWNIDNLGRVTSIVDPLNHVSTYEYDLNDNLTRYVDRNGRVNVYEYDALNHMTAEKWYDGGSPTRTLSYGYDLGGRLTSTSDPSATYGFSYDYLDRQTTATLSLPSLSPVTFVNGYDNNDNRTSLAATIGNTPDFLNSYVYDHLDRLINLQQTGNGGNAVASKQVGLAWNLDGQLARLTRFNHLVTDPLAPTTILNESLVDSAYGYDLAGQLRTVASSINGPSGASSIINAWNYDAVNRATLFYSSTDGMTSYNYDQNNQLTSVTGVGAHTYAYDAGGNRTATDSVGTAIGAGNRLTDDGTYTYEYDNEGNMVRRTQKSGTGPDAGRVLMLWYDHRDRLTSVAEAVNLWTSPFFTLTYEYDTFDRRVARTKTVSVDGGEGGNSTTTTTSEKFIYDGDNVALDFYRANGGAYQLEHRYLYGPAVDQVLAQENLIRPDGMPILTTASIRVYWLLGDNLGTVRDILDNTGKVTQHYIYDAYGQILSGTTLLTRYLYTGREYDFDTHLQYNRARWYDPETGRFLSEDPAADDTNLHAYAGNSPTNARDPSGMWAEPEDWLVDSPELIPVVPRYRNHQIVGSMGWDNQVGNSLVPALGFFNALAEILAGTFIPGVGEIQDAAVIADPDAPAWQKTLSTASIGYSVWTLGEGPNAGSFFRAADQGAGAAGQAARIHGNSLNYFGDTHVYRIVGPDGSTYKIGQSMRGVRAADGMSIRGESQVRSLQRETGEFYRSEIRRVFSTKRSAVQYETELIQRFRRRYGEGGLPGNLSNR